MFCVRARQNHDDDKKTALSGARQLGPLHIVAIVTEISRVTFPLPSAPSRLQTWLCWRAMLRLSMYAACLFAQTSCATDTDFTRLRGFIDLSGLNLGISSPTCVSYFNISILVSDDEPDNWNYRHKLRLKHVHSITSAGDATDTKSTPAVIYSFGNNITLTTTHVTQHTLSLLAVATTGNTSFTSCAYRDVLKRPPTMLCPHIKQADTPYLPASVNINKTNCGALTAPLNAYARDDTQTLLKIN